MIIDDAPAVWLYEPLTVIGIHRRFDMPALRAGGWWLDIPRWSVRPGEQIKRDREVPASAVAPVEP